MSTCVRFNDDHPSLVFLWSASQKGSTQCNSPDLLSLSLSVFLRLCLSSTLPSRWQRWKERKNKTQGFWIRTGVRGLVCMTTFHLKRKKNISQVQSFVRASTRLYPQSCVLVSSECYVFDMRVNNRPDGKCSVCVFTVLHTLRWGSSLSSPLFFFVSLPLSLPSLHPSQLWRVGSKQRIKVCLFYV